MRPEMQQELPLPSEPFQPQQTLQYNQNRLEREMHGIPRLEDTVCLLVGV